MLNDSVTRVSWRSRPRSFVALMSLYESNYVRLGWLAGALTSLSGSHRSTVAGDCDLLLDVTERCPYTTTLNLTYRLGGPGEGEGAGSAELRYPDMGIRIYHDANLVEALEWSTPASRGTVARTHSHGVLQALQRHAERELDQRWGRNMMLNKWLEYCLERGHRFSPATLIPAY